MAAALGTAAGVIGICGFAITSAQSLIETIDRFGSARNDLTRLSRDLQTLSDTLANIKTNLEQASQPTSQDDSLSRALESSKDECSRFKTRLEDWTRHSTPEAMSRRDRVNVAVFQTGPIASFSRRLSQINLTLQLAIQGRSIEVDAAQQRMTGEIGAQINQLTDNLNLHASNITTRLAALDVQERTIVTSPDYQTDAYASPAEEREDIRLERTQLAASAARDQSVREATGRLRQEFLEVDISDNASVQMGHFGSPLESGTITQIFNGVRARGNANVFAGTGENIDVSNFCWNERRRPGAPGLNE